jgi:uncharacterized membrane protein YhiD involved in acid resistance
MLTSVSTYTMDVPAEQQVEEVVLTVWYKKPSVQIATIVGVASAIGYATAVRMNKIASPAVFLTALVCSIKNTFQVAESQQQEAEQKSVEVQVTDTVERVVQVSDTLPIQEVPANNPVAQENTPSVEQRTMLSVFKKYIADSMQVVADKEVENNSFN